MPERDFITKRRRNFKNDLQLISAIKDTIHDNYVDTEHLIEREINHCDNIIYTENDAGEILCFAMYNFEKLDKIETCYVGLTASRNNAKSSGMASHLWRCIATECQEKQKELECKLLIWLTTPTPIVFYWFINFLHDAEPFIDGSFSPRGELIINKLKASKYPKAQASEIHPFVLKNVAMNTRYSYDEQIRINAAEKKLKISAFKKYNVDETAGDRFLIIGFLRE